MISIYKIDKTNYEKGEEKMSVELRGLSTDEKPINIGSTIVDNGSAFIEIDTGKVFLYDLENEEWEEI